MSHTKTPAQALAELTSKGLSMNRWARMNGLNPATVRAVLTQGRPYRIGESHKAAVKLGMKIGEIIEENDLDEAA
jgi:gp16 family phage-associated protein